MFMSSFVFKYAFFDVLNPEKLRSSIKWCLSGESTAFECADIIEIFSLSVAEMVLVNFADNY